MSNLLHEVVERASEIILGKRPQIQRALSCVLARGHLLIEDLPGVGKTTLAHVLAKTLGLDYQRIQFTSDLLPADVLGVSIFDREAGGFQFHAGPIFSQLILADEINRATPKTQSAMLEAMEERQVSIEGKTRPLPEPFFVIATQNPSYQIGTFPLPESQLDRFLMRIELGYPDTDAECAMLAGSDRRQMTEALPAVLDLARLQALQRQADAVHVSEALIHYVQSLLAFSRATPHYAAGLSPRAGLALLRCARAWALLQGRDFVLPEDVQAILPNVVCHRLRAGDGLDNTQDLLQPLLDVAIP